MYLPRGFYVFPSPNVSKMTHVLYQRHPLQPACIYSAHQLGAR